MVVVFPVFGSRLGVKEIVARDEFEDLDNGLEKKIIIIIIKLAIPRAKGQEERTYHASHTPNIRASPPLGSQNDLGRTVLASLNIIGKVMANPAGVA